MAIKSVQFDSAFQIALDWVAGVRRIIVYSRPAGAGPMDGAALLDAMCMRRNYYNELENLLRNEREQTKEAGENGTD